jgi:hypothetical protein
MIAVYPFGYKILVRTSIYPADGVSEELTPIVHYFICEWIKKAVEKDDVWKS